MANSSTRKVVEKDIVSKLPRNLQETILDLLPIRDAVRTSIVSKRWRYFWTIIPRLIFDDEFLMSISPILDRYQDPKQKTRELLSLIDKILQLHSGPLLKFSVKFLRSDARMINDQINQWIPLLSRKCLKQLTLQNFHSIGCPHFDFHPKKFSSLKLSHLKLRFACLTEPGAFTYLTNLKLEICCVPKLSFGEYCVFQCPVLQRLTLKGCFGLYHTHFHAPNLKSLCLEAFDIALEGLNTITDFTFCLLIRLKGLGGNFQPSRTYNVATLLGCLHKVERLAIGYYSLQHLAYTASSIPERAPEPLSYLKDLIIDFVDFTNMLEVTCIVYTIRSAPYLRNLVIAGWSARMDDVDGESVQNFQVEDSGKCNLDNLEYVEFRLFKGLRTEMELIKFIAARSPLLKEMYIHYTEHMKMDEVAQEIEEFAFDSPVAQICFVSESMSF